MTTPHLKVRFTNELMTLTEDLDQAAAAAFVDKVLAAGREVAAADTFETAQHLYRGQETNERTIRALSARLLQAGVDQNEIDRLLDTGHPPGGPQPE
ncbi:hypothetical protein [Phaeacidiphilus oryzae]|uniref:hypothetical protein n=1 Tax=Phaeacidiphilus oryzae TaxID=348818 RepID=UPI00055F5D3E|nr:hypothetical protein [Phaeacidiphilus oryzae]